MGAQNRSFILSIGICEVSFLGFACCEVAEFKYSTTTHNVYEVTKATYQSCDASTGVVAKYRSGDDKIELKEARPYWFLCDIQGHCLGGMRFGIDVAANATSSTALSPSQSTTQPPPPSSSKASRARIDTSWPVEQGLVSSWAPPPSPPLLRVEEAEGPLRNPLQQNCP
ncbi:hypothetical protein V2J09_021046 [Rumex salicifolius]